MKRLLLLLLFISNCAVSEGASLEEVVTVKHILPEDERVQYIGQGWSAPRDGYFMPEPTGRAILAEWKADAEKAVYFEAKLNEVLDNQQAFLASMDKRIADLTEATRLALAEKDKQIRAQKIKNRTPGVGLFAGYGINNDEFVYGVGIVWKIF